MGRRRTAYGLPRRRDRRSPPLSNPYAFLRRSHGRRRWFGNIRTLHECVFAVLAMESEPVDPRL
ncbi:MAG: hypothetical protein IT432_14890 [Phycisphaerales bacterium]|nr:hypothetical protein [Phycisphaerales bacterium]